MDLSAIDKEPDFLSRRAVRFGDRFKERDPPLHVEVAINKKLAPNAMRGRGSPAPALAKDSPPVSGHGKAFSECAEEDSALHRGQQLSGFVLNCINTQAKSQAWLQRPRELVVCQHV